MDNRFTRKYTGKEWAGFIGAKEELSGKAKDVPDEPGVYIFQDDKGEVLYVGKASSLRKRLRSYFTGKPAPKTEALMARVGRLDTITVDTEMEALILESNLIKKHKPKYNILLRDDKHYPYLRLNLNEDWPWFTVVRRMQKDGAKYFGPFRGGSLRETLSLLRRIFPYRTCTDRTLAQTTRPCLDYHIGRCPGPCTGQIDREQYMAVIKDAVAFLEGRHSEVRKSLEARMKDMSERYEFESAAKVRDQIRALDDVTEKQKIIMTDMKDRDVLGVACSKEVAAVALLPVRKGKLMGREGFILSGISWENISGILGAFISQHYSEVSYVPRELVVPEYVANTKLLEELLTGYSQSRQDKPRKVKIIRPRKGELKSLVDMANENAGTLLAEYVPRREREEEENLKAMEEMARALGMDRLPRRVEGYDISNTSGQEAVASMVVMTDGRPDKSQYRHFNMKITGKPDDYAMMQEVLWRRFRKVSKGGNRGEGPGKLRFAKTPDLILVDGGKGQVNAAKEVLDELGLEIDLVGLAKRNEELYLPGKPEPVILARDSKALYMVMRLRDEAHRFAVTHHRARRRKSVQVSELDDIPGLGKKRAKELLIHFGDISAIKKASFEQLQKCPGIGPVFASKILAHFHNSIS